MTGQLREEETLLGRFVLRRCLRTDPRSHLWAADDRQLDTPVLLRVFAEPQRLGTGLDAIRLDARQNRRINHPSVARIGDLHEGSDWVIVSIDPPRDGELLSTHLRRTGPLSYRDVVEQIRPLVEGLQHIHDVGGEHGRLDTDHVLIEGEGRWVILPADGTKPADSDMSRLGRLMVAALTGGREPEGGRQLNDVAERLHAGRTVPALLNQLVEDLAVKDARQRPAGMRDVLQRLDQLERFLGPSAPPPSEPEPAPVVESAPASASSAAPPPPQPVPRPRAVSARAARVRPKRITAPRLALVALPVGLLVGGVYLGRPESPQDDVDKPIVIVPATPPAGSSAAEDPVVDERARAEARQAADAALSRAIAARRELEAIGGGDWGGELYATAVSTSDDADRAFLDEQYADAVELYNDAATAFNELAGDKDAALARLLADGRAALQTPDAARATEAFTLAALIDPGNDEAEIGRARAATLDELHRRLATGLEHEMAGRLDLAYADYGAAADLDPHSVEAAAAEDRVKDALALEQFQSMMSLGLDAYHRGAYAEARARLLEAQRFRPDADGVTSALAMVEEAERRAAVTRFRDLALEHERQEQWQGAWNTYRQVLAIDDDVAFAQDGKARCESMIRLEKRVARLLADPDLLSADETREQAQVLVQELADMPNKGPRLQAAADRLTEQVRLANTPLRVALLSDGETEVAVYRVGKYGAFETKTLELLPGVYTVVGHRIGYKDVRLTWRLRPGEHGVTLEVICRERI